MSWGTSLFDKRDSNIFRGDFYKMIYIDKFISEIKEKILVNPDIIEQSTPEGLATQKDITASEDDLGIKLPESYKKFVSEYSNGDIYMLGAEPMNGVSKASRIVEPAYKFLMESPKKEIKILPTNKTIKLDKLISFTSGDARELSNDHWVFICDKNYYNNEYPVGYVSFKTHNIVCLLSSFEEWIKVFWEYNKKLNTEYFFPVFHILYPDFIERDKLLSK